MATSNNNIQTLVLASASPRRKELLEQAGYNLIILPADVDETLPDGISPDDAVKYLANKKAEACAKFILKEKPELTDLPIVAADTVVYKDEIMGKPMDRQDAKRMIQTISGTFHHVATGVAIILPALGKKDVFCDVTKVYCKNLSDDDVEAYLDTDEPYDKAGAYAIQGIFGKYIEKFEGRYDTVVGLPVGPITEVLNRFNK